MQLSVVILAAGQGQRMNSDLPKVLQPLAGRPLLRHVIDTARELSPHCIYVVYGHGGAEVQGALFDAKVDWVLQAEQLGTAHAVMQAMPLIADDHRVMVLYGDVPLIRAASLRELLAAAGDQAMALLTATLDDPSGYGRVVRDANGRVSAVIEQRDATPEQRGIREINTGVMTAPAKRLREWLLGIRNDNAHAEYYLTDTIAAAVASGGAVHAVAAADSAEIIGVNDKLQLAAVEAAYRRARTGELMIAGATLADPLRVDVRGEVEVGRDVYIDVNAVLVGKVRLGARVKIGPNCVVGDSEIGAGTEIFANCVIDRASVGEDCRIGPYARLRPGTKLRARVHVGNFVEVKNSELGSGSKANHLSYLGDAQVGSGVNVGAGTITCNYDGANKWTTTIGDGAFIGSGSMLVAPVGIGARATIGAGSTITADAPAGKLTLTRAAQATVEGWVRPAAKAVTKPKA